MQEKLNRRDWFKTSLALTAGLSVTPALVQNLMAAPVSEAERAFLKQGKTTGAKVRLNSNENPYGPSEKAKKAVMQVLTEGNRYAFNEQEDLKKIIAQKEGVDPSFILIGIPFCKRVRSFRTETLSGNYRWGAPSSSKRVPVSSLEFRRGDAG